MCNKAGVDIKDYLDDNQLLSYNLACEFDDFQNALKLVYNNIVYNHKLDDPINLGSPSQLSTLFYNIIGYKTKSGKGTGVEDLEEINSDLTRALLEYRKMSKLIDAFLVALPKQIEPSTGKIHTYLNQYGAATGKICLAKYINNI